MLTIRGGTLAQAAFWALLTSMLMTACSYEDPIGPGRMPDEAPEDFRLVYSFREGSIPPPHYCEFQVVVSIADSGVRMEVAGRISISSVPAGSTTGRA